MDMMAAEQKVQDIIHSLRRAERAALREAAMYGAAVDRCEKAQRKNPWGRHCPDIQRDEKDARDRARRAEEMIARLSYALS